METNRDGLELIIMSNYVSQLSKIISDFSHSVMDSTGKKYNLEVRNFFFGGAACYVCDKIFLTLTKVGLGIKLSDADLKIIFELGGRELKYFEKGYVKKEYVILPENVISDASQLFDWIRTSIAFMGKKSA